MKQEKKANGTIRWISCLQIALTFVAFCFIRMWFQSRDGLNMDNEDNARIPLSKFPNSQILNSWHQIPTFQLQIPTQIQFQLSIFQISEMLMRELFWLEKNVLRELLNIKLTAEKIHPNIYTIRRKNPAKSQESPRKNPRKSQEISGEKMLGWITIRTGPISLSQYFPLLRFYVPNIQAPVDVGNVSIRFPGHLILTYFPVSLFWPFLS